MGLLKKHFRFLGRSEIKQGQPVAQAHFSVEGLIFDGDFSEDSLKPLGLFSCCPAATWHEEFNEIEGNLRREIASNSRMLLPSNRYQLAKRFEGKMRIGLEF